MAHLRHVHLLGSLRAGADPFRFLREPVLSPLAGNLELLLADSIGPVSEAGIGGALRLSLQENFK